MKGDLVIPCWIFNDAALSPAQRLFLAKLCQLCAESEDMSTTLTNQQLADMFNVSDDTITAWVNCLAMIKAIDVEHNLKGNGRAIWVNPKYKPTKTTCLSHRRDADMDPEKPLTAIASFLLRELVREKSLLYASNLAIAEYLGVSEATVKRRIKELLVKRFIRVEFHRLPDGRKGRKITIEKSEI